MTNINEMTVTELKELQTTIKEMISAKRDEAKSEKQKLRAEREETFKSNLKAGQNVSFFFGRENELAEGVVIRVSEKSATIQSDIFAERKGSKNYVAFHRFVEILTDATETEKVAV